MSRAAHALREALQAANERRLQAMIPPVEVSPVEAPRPVVAPAVIDDPDGPIVSAEIPIGPPRVCHECGGDGVIYLEDPDRKVRCEACLEVGFVRLPDGPCPHPPGSPDKIAWLAFRMRNAMPLFLDDDRNAKPDATVRPFSCAKGDFPIPPEPEPEDDDSNPPQ